MRLHPRHARTPAHAAAPANQHPAKLQGQGRGAPAPGLAQASLCCRPAAPQGTTHLLAECFPASHERDPAPPLTRRPGQHRGRPARALSAAAGAPPAACRPHPPGPLKTHPPTHLPLRWLHHPVVPMSPAIAWHALGSSLQGGCCAMCDGHRVPLTTARPSARAVPLSVGAAQAQHHACRAVDPARRRQRPAARRCSPRPWRRLLAVGRTAHTAEQGKPSKKATWGGATCLQINPISPQKTQQARNWHTAVVVNCPHSTPLIRRAQAQGITGSALAAQGAAGASAAALHWGACGSGQQGGLAREPRMRISAPLCARWRLAFGRRWRGRREQTRGVLEGAGFAWLVWLGSAGVHLSRSVGASW